MKMLSTFNSSIQKRRQQHRRQNSTPTIFEATKVPTTLSPIAQRHNGHRRGMSLNQKAVIPASFQDNSAPTQETPIGQDSLTVSINTNIGQTPLQHSVQVAQQQSQAQPGPQCPKTPLQLHHALPAIPATPTGPTEQQIRELEEHIKSVYGAYGTVFVNILPTPLPTPQKSRTTIRTDTLDLAPMPSGFGDLSDLSLGPPADFQQDIPMERSDTDNGYESSYYSSDGFSQARSPSSSPIQRVARRFPKKDFESMQPAIREEPSLVSSPQGLDDLDDLFAPDSDGRTRRELSPGEINLDATIEDTGISPEEVQAYISEQDPVTHRWTCLFPGCDKTFGRRENIRSHVQTHLGDRQYRCNHCGKCFVRQHDLKRHAKIHTGDKPYKCQCGGGFARQDALTRHRQRGMCIGGFPNAMRRQARRGRPKKKRPELEERLDKSSRTRRALAFSSSSSSGMSPDSDAFSPVGNFDRFDMSQFADLQSLSSDSDASSDPSRFESASASFINQLLQDTSSFDMSTGLDTVPESDQLFNMPTDTFNQTPPMSPVNKEAVFNGTQFISHQIEQGASNQVQQTPRSTSNPFTTPPSSPNHQSPPASTLFLEGDASFSTQYDAATNVPAMDMSIFCDTLLGNPGTDLADEETLKASIAWINEL